MTETRPMLTPKDVAGILGVHQKTVHLWLRNGKLKGIKISYRAWRIPQPALEEFIEQNSNVLQPKGAGEQKETGEGILPANPLHEPIAVNNDSPQAKMKYYLQDIMGEEKNPGR